MRRFIIERDIEGVGGFTPDQLGAAATTSNKALCEIGGRDIQWVHSYVTDDRTYCLYLASDEAAIRRHAELSGFPASRIAEVRNLIDPATAG